MQTFPASLTLMLLLIAACSSPSQRPVDGMARSLLLGRMLDARDERRFSDVLQFHGSITDDDVPEILKATKHWSSSKRRNAARGLLLLRSDNRDAVQLGFFTETEDVDAWAVLAGGFQVLDHHPDWAGKRPDLIKKGLGSSQPETLAAAIRAGAISHYPGIEAVVEGLLDDKSQKVREACLESMTPELAARFLPHLKQMVPNLSDQTGRSRELLVMALLSSHDVEMRKAIRDYYEAGDRTGRLEFASMLNIHAEPWIEDLLWEYWQTPDKRDQEDGYLDPVQVNALDSMLWHIADKKDLQVKPRWVNACIAVESGPYRKRNTLDESCAKLAYFLSGKQQGREWMDDPVWTLRTLRKWLASHPA